MRFLPLILFTSLGLTQSQTTKPKLVYTVILSRHGVRSPTSANSAYQQYAADPWPTWEVAPGELTPHGAKLLTMLGGWYRDWLAQDGLLTPAGCESAHSVHMRADAGQRTQASARAFLDGMFPGCGIAAETVTVEVDPLFHPAGAGMVHADPAASVAAISTKLDSRPEALPPALIPAFETLRQVLFGCASNAPCPAESEPGKQALLGLPASVAATEDGLADVRGPLRTGSTLTENLLLEYVDGKIGSDLGWGRLDEAKLSGILAIHAAYADLARRTQALARPQGSNLLSHILSSMEQAASGKSSPGALGKSGDRLLLLAGHDTNIAHVSGMLNLTWQLPGFPRDDTPPGGSLVFRLWQSAPGAYSVDALYIAQSMNQMRAAAPLTRKEPPAIARIAIPGCPASGCDWPTFRKILARSIDATCVKN